MKTEIIAELAQGYAGSLEQARLLIKAAASAGADAAKFQLVYADELATPEYKYYELFRALEMPDEAWENLAGYAIDLGINLYLDIFGGRSLQLAERIGINSVKLHGTDITNIRLLNLVAQSCVENVLLGAGGANLSEIREALNILVAKNVTILVGFQGYPTPTNANQIARVAFLADSFKKKNPRVTIGYADHAPTESASRYAIAVLAVGAGARVLEKHLTLGMIMKLEDYESALNPDDFAEFSKIIRDCSEALGYVADGIDFGMSKSEQDYRLMIRRHVVTTRELRPGAIIGAADLALKRTASKRPIMDLTLAYGMTVKRTVEINTPLSFDDIELQ